MLHEIEGYRHEDISQLLGISSGASKSQLHKARLRLCTALGAPRWSMRKKLITMRVPLNGNGHRASPRRAEKVM